MTWQVALVTVRKWAIKLVPAQEVDDLVSRVMFELVRRCLPAESGGDGAEGVRSLSGLGCSICQKRAVDVFRELRRRGVFVPLEQAADVTSAGAVDLESGSEQPVRKCVERRFRGAHQKAIAAVLRAGGTLADAQAATKLGNAEFAKVLRRMVEPPES